MGPWETKRKIKQMSLLLFYKNKALRPTPLPHATSVCQTCAIRRFVDNQVPPLLCQQTCQSKFHTHRGVATIELSTPLFNSKINETGFSSDTALSVSKVISCLWFCILLRVKMKLAPVSQAIRKQNSTSCNLLGGFPALGTGSFHLL